MRGRERMKWKANRRGAASSNQIFRKSATIATSSSWFLRSSFILLFFFFSFCPNSLYSYPFQLYFFVCRFSLLLFFRCFFSLFDFLDSSFSLTLRLIHVSLSLCLSSSFSSCRLVVDLWHMEVATTTATTTYIHKYMPLW